MANGAVVHVKAPVEMERALVIHPRLSGNGGGMDEGSRMEEFKRLVVSSGCRLCASLTLSVRRQIPSTFFGRGQVARVQQEAAAHQAKVVFVDAPLSPIQHRNLERAWKVKVVDRTGLILEIFASRARTREGVLQVELASLNYQVSRLVRSWTHLERQRGGYGFLGGPGERQIEIDRRLIRNRIRKLERELAHVRKIRTTQRMARKRKSIPTIALVGYTNAGKSTLFNRLTQAHVYADNRLFATLDPTMRRVALPGGGTFILSDTVGFIQDLPHELIDAFSATLEEVAEADLILHVRDAADANHVRQAQVVYETLDRLGMVGDRRPPIIEVLNKKDLVPGLKHRLREGIGGSKVAVSAKTGEGLDLLLALIERWLERTWVEKKLRLEPSDGRTMAFCHERGHVLSCQSTADVVEIVVRLPRRDACCIAFREGYDRLIEDAA